MSPIPATVLTLALVLIAAPPALAASIHVSLDGDYESGSTVALPPDGKARLPFDVVVEAQGFYCVEECIVGVVANLDQAGFPGWAGASFNPDDTEVEIPPGEPGMATRVYRSDEPVVLEIAWNNEARPNRGDAYTYSIGFTALSAEGSSVPLLQEQEFSFEPYNITFTMDDWIPDDLPEECQFDATYCETPTPRTAMVSSEEVPGPGLSLLGFALAAAIGLRRRAA